MSTIIPIVEFDVSERVSIEVIHRQSAALAENPLTTELLNSVLNYVFILNQHRQIVFASQNCKELFPGKTMESLLGLRPGEALVCEHVADLKQSCGCTPFCQECGAAKAIIASLLGRKSIEECHLTRIINCQPESVDLLVYAIPFVYKGDRFSILSIADISHEKRRQALERVFFHDVLASAGGLDGLVSLLEREVSTEERAEHALLHRGLKELLDEIQIQRDLALAEKDELMVHSTEVDTLQIIEAEIKEFENHPTAQKRKISVDPKSFPLHFKSDSILIRRILGYLIKNALEAIPENATVTVSCLRDNQNVRFSVHNPGMLTPQAELQVFQRSFTTKGTGRGLGTYSAKLLTEKYLHGKVGFSSTREKGTVFWFSIPPEAKRRPVDSPRTSARLSGTSV